MYSLQYTGRFKKDVKRCVKRGLPIAKLESVIETLRQSGTLPAEYHTLINLLEHTAAVGNDILGPIGSWSGNKMMKNSSY